MSLQRFYDVMIRLSAKDGASTVLTRVEQNLAKLHRSVAPAMASTSANDIKEQVRRALKELEREDLRLSFAGF